MGAAIARDAPPSVQTLVSALLRVRLEVALAGLDGAGKTTLAGALRAPTAPPESTAPTLGLVVRSARHRGVDLVVWDLGGHHRFRDDWSRHARGCGVLIFVLDVTDMSRLGEARQALQRLLEDPAMGTKSLLVLVNKVDLLPPAQRASEELRGWPTLVQELNLDCLDAQCRWSVLGLSATRRSNLDKVLRWLLLEAHGAGGDAAHELGDVGAGPGGGGRLWRAVDSLAASWRRRRKRWGSRAGFTLAASLIGADED